MIDSRLLVRREPVRPPRAMTGVIANIQRDHG